MATASWACAGAGASMALRRALLVIFLTCLEGGQGASPGARLPEPLGPSQVTKVPARLGLDARPACRGYPRARVTPDGRRVAGWQAEAVSRPGERQGTGQQAR